ncbi:MAG: tripartite tricarboxylate transporter TctB family protein [Desulfuromonadales bacterium]|nr:tripartite tricarboxylate transporter TctB family protein [Desulfuromonadales bacterium]
MKQYAQDRIIVVVGLALVMLGLWICNSYPDESAFFPELCLYAIGILLVLLTIDSEIDKRKTLSSGDTPLKAIEMKWGPFLLVTGILAVYGISVVYLGFYFSSLLFLVTVGFFWGGVKKTTVLIFSACFLLFVYACFTLLFNVPLPAGIGR